MRLKLLPFLFSMFFGGLLFGQVNPWTDINESAITADPQARRIFPDRYRTVRLNLPLIQSALTTAPQEAEFVAGDQGLQIEFPMPDGGFSTFECWEAPVMAPELTAQFPDIRSYAGRNRTGDYIRFSVTPSGLRAMVLTLHRSNAIFIDPFARGNVEDYQCYFKKDYPRPDGDLMECLTESGELTDESGVNDRAGSCGSLRTYRLALACTGEYAAYHLAFGDDKQPALDAMATTMTRVNGVFEIDCGLRMIMVANNANVVYTNASTDPYTNNNGSSMLSQNQTTCNAQIGTGNYDIGHVFSTGGGGVAYLRSVCGSYKAGGVTGGPSPEGDPFDIDYVAHEMGHQFGGDHTQYNNCQRTSASAMEPGSASSIMGYAGICSPNVQNNSDAYFHARSIQQIAAFINGSGNACATPVSNGNSAPVVAALVNKTIPKSTPFVLTASATDPNSDPLTYCWEQMDAHKNPAQPMPPTTTNKSGPVFRTFNPAISPSRYFPKLSSVLAGNNNGADTWEKVPSIARTLNFRVTVRDNHANGGCTSERDVTLTVTSNAGPFVVTAPNTAVNWMSNSPQTVTWSVAGTNANGVNCANVTIRLSTDGGTTWSTLVASTANDGSESVNLPNTGTSQARIMVQAADNYFYDVSNTNFTITASQPADFGNGNNSQTSVDILTVFPNPTTGLIRVQAPAEWQDTPLQLRIWDLEGRLLHTDANFISGNTVDVSTLLKGTFQVEVIRGSEKLNSMFIRQ